VRDWPTALVTHLQGENATAALTWRFTRSDGEVLAFIEHDQDFTQDAIVHRASSAPSTSAVRATVAMQVDTSEADGAFSDDVTLADCLAGRWDFAEVEIAVVNWADASMGRGLIRRARVGGSRYEGGTFQVELHSLVKALHQHIGETTSAWCRYDLGDTRCTVTLASHTVTGTVTSTSSRRLFVDSARTEAATYFPGGKVTFTSGDNDGLTREIKAWNAAGKQFELFLPFPYAIQVGDAYSAVRGCAKTPAACKEFSNYVNFGGEPDLPGNDKLQRYGQLGT